MFVRMIARRKCSKFVGKGRRRPRETKCRSSNAPCTDFLALARYPRLSYSAHFNTFPLKGGLILSQRKHGVLQPCSRCSYEPKALKMGRQLFTRRRDRAMRSHYLESAM